MLLRLRRKDTEGTRRRAYPSDTGERKRLPPGGRAACVGQGCWEVSGDGTGIEEVNGSHTHCPAEAEPHGGAGWGAALSVLSGPGLLDPCLPSAVDRVPTSPNTR